MATEEADLGASLWNHTQSSWQMSEVLLDSSILANITIHIDRLSPCKVHSWNMIVQSTRWLPETWGDMGFDFWSHQATAAAHSITI